MERLREHRYALTSAFPLNSAVAEHAMNTGHNINWKEIKILSICKSKNKRCALESWYIKTLDSRLNRDQGTLSSDYDCLIKKIKKERNS